jgi:hypothetical protein
MERNKSLREVAQEWLVWAKQHRTEKYWKRQEQILNEQILPTIGDLPITKIIQDLPGSVLLLPPEQGKAGLSAHRTVTTIIGWKLNWKL